ncbi:MAG: glycosyltransferase family 4 protein [Nanoarchaeota archaeon]|nr:glycosyltransferase family 4 protein [Nanoarchaeota archaeon]
MDNGDDNPRGRRICILTFFYSPAGGGIPRYVDNLSKKFVEMGHKVDIITASYDEEQIEKKDNLTVYLLPCMNIFSKTEQENKASARDLIDFLRKYVKKEKPSIFSAQSFHTAFNAIGHSLALNMVALERKIPLTLTVHSFVQNDESEQIKMTSLKDLLWDKIISIGPTLGEFLLEKGVSREKISISYPGVDINQFRPGLGKKWLRSRIGISESDILILYAGRVDSIKIAESKGIMTLLKAMSSIKNKKVKLLISAAQVTPPFKEAKDEAIEKIKERAKLLNKADKIIIETFSPENMPLVYNGADICVLPSKDENCSLFISESMACGLPVIATTVGGIPDIVENGKTANLVPPDDSVELAKQIGILLRSPSKAKKMGEEARKTLEEMQELGKVCRNLLGIYESVIKKKENKTQEHHKPLKSSAIPTSKPTILL